MRGSGLDEGFRREALQLGRDTCFNFVHKNERHPTTGKVGERWVRKTTVWGFDLAWALFMHCIRSSHYLSRERERHPLQFDRDGVH